MTTLIALPAIDDRRPISDPAVAKQFALAGNATFTLVSLRTGTRFTYRVRASEDGSIHFVSLLTGSDNTSNYQYLGHIFSDGRFVHGRKSRISRDVTSAKAFAWYWDALVRGVLPPESEFWHEGRCGRCARKLTVPSSLENGLGPDCLEIMTGQRRAA